MSEPVPRVLIELLALGELDAADAEAVRRQLGDALDGELQAIAQSNEDLLARYPDPPARPSATSGRRNVVYLVAAVALAAAVVAAVGIVRLDERTLSPLDPERSGMALGSGIRHKGQPALLVFRPESKDPLRDGQRIAAGQLLQISYSAAGAAHGVIVSIDGRGDATLHFPSVPNGSTALQPGEHRLDHAFELDDAPRFERFFFVTAQAALDVEKVHAAAKALATRPDATTAALQLPEGFAAGSEQTSLLLLK